jgi:hypothetical protein
VKKIRDWILSNLTYVQLLLILLVGIASFISNYVSNYTIVIISLLIFIGSEFFVLSVGYLEQILKRLNDLHPEERAKCIENQKYQIHNYVKNIQHEIIITGYTFLTINNVEMHELSKLPDNIKIKLLALDLDDKKLVDNYLSIYKNMDDKLTNLGELQRKTLFDYLSAKDNVEVRLLEFIPPGKYIAIDINYETKYSFIKVEHPLASYNFKKHENKKLAEPQYNNIAKSENDDSKEHENDHTIGYIHYPGTDAYDVYKNDINYLWGEGIPINKI